MNLNTTILATKYSTRNLLETQIAYEKFILEASQITQKNNSELIRSINTDEYNNHMNLKDIVDTSLKTYDKISDTIRLSRGLMYFVDGERYRLLHDEQTFKYFKRKCIQEFKKLSDPDIIRQYKEQMSSYLPKKYLK
jgi:hypothetical protein